MNTENKLKKLLKPVEVAELFGISIRTLYDWSASGRVPSIKINGTLRFDYDEIIHWIEKHKLPIGENLNNVAE